MHIILCRLKYSTRSTPIDAVTTKEGRVNVHLGANQVQPVVMARLLLEPQT